MKSAMQLKSTLTCPACGHQAVETMPTDACQFFYECKGCGAILKPLAGGLLCVLFLRLSSMPANPRGAGEWRVGELLRSEVNAHRTQRRAPASFAEG
jgi:hypothetical protein